jgi:hypothetical protein
VTRWLRSHSKWGLRTEDIFQSLELGCWLSHAKLFLRIKWENLKATAPELLAI